MPLPVTVQLAWLTAFNDGRFDDIDPEDVSAQLDVLIQHTRHSELTLDSPREEWLDLIAGSFGPARKTQT